MNGRSEQDRREGAAQDATAWLLRLDAPDATESDWLALQAWLEAAPEHRAAFDRLERVSAELKAAAPELLRALDAPSIITSAPRRRRAAVRGAGPRQGTLWRMAAGLAAAAAALVVFVAVRPPAPAPTDIYQTAKGESRVLDLADGSRIHLNSASRVAVRLEPKGRYVELTEGEVGFNVVHDPARPFLVAAGERHVRVVGTEFDVLRHQGRLRVTVLDGRVAVESPRGAPRAEPVLLSAGDQLEHRAATRVWTVRRVDPAAAFAWRRGELVYVDQPLDEVVEDLNRYFSTPVQVAGAAAALRFSGVLRMDAQEAVVRRLEAFLPVSADRGAEGVTLRLREGGA